MKRKHIESDGEKQIFLYETAGKQLSRVAGKFVWGSIIFGLGVGLLQTLHNDIGIGCVAIGSIISLLLFALAIDNLSNGIYNYTMAKDSERDAILEKLDQINSNIERVYNMGYSINMQIHEGMYPEDRGGNR